MSSMKKTKEGINLKKLLRLKNTGSIFVIAGLLMRVENDKAREFYMQEAVKSQWSTRQLESMYWNFLG